jgi:hypothetical protein
VDLTDSKSIISSINHDLPRSDLSSIRKLVTPDTKVEAYGGTGIDENGIVPAKE